jgi:DNA-binding NtrC family response regulator
VLQEHEVDRVGGTVPVKVDVRVIAATNRDIARLVAEGRFREDLYYRLQGMVVRVPALRERKPEISGLVEHFRREVVEAGQSHVRTFSTDAMDELFRRDWPGNIRELRNTVYRALVFARGEVVQHRDVIAALAGSGPATAAPPPAAPTAPTVAAPLVAAPSPVATAPAATVPVTPPAPSVPPPAEPTFVVPAVPAAPADAATVAAAAEAALPERLKTLHALIVARGVLKTEDHMKAANVSHRTGLRDLQYLVTAGLVERVGTRRGTFYRPVGRS